MFVYSVLSYKTMLLHHSVPTSIVIVTLCKLRNSSETLHHTHWRNGCNNSDRFASCVAEYVTVCQQQTHSVILANDYCVIFVTVIIRQKKPSPKG